MFYSHEILTSRKSGVATVWLVATLGSRSNLKKVNRKAILEVDVPNTCRKIIEPEAPMALRLQSTLLYGVSRVFSQQCGYILSDAQVAQANMRALIKAVQSSELDLNAGKARPDQLVLQDDPGFLPELALPGLDIDLSALDISMDESSRRSSILFPSSQRSSVSSHPEDEESMVGLVIPSSASGGAGDIGGFYLPSEHASSAQRNARPGILLEEDAEDFNIDPGFSIDAEGYLIDEPMSGAVAAPFGMMRLESDSRVSGRVGPPSPRGPEEEHGAMDLGLYLPRVENDDLILPEAEPFPTIATRPPPGAGVLRSTREPREERESTESVIAPPRRKPRIPKELPFDERQELHNADLAQWKTNYLTNMAEARAAKISHKASSIAKVNAAFWVMGSGIGGIGAAMRSSKYDSPLGIFAGDAFMEALTGTKVFTTGRKRARDDEEYRGSDSEARRRRVEEDQGEEVGRGDQIILNDDGTLMTSAIEDIEVGRATAPALPEDPSFPWNVSSAMGSRQASVARARGFGSSVAGFPSSAGAPRSLPDVGGIPPGSLDRRANRITSASPLTGRGLPRYSSLELPLAEDDVDLIGGHSASSDRAPDDFEMYGPAAAVDTQTAAQSQWMKATLDREAHNFLDFVKAEITAVEGPAGNEEDEIAGDARAKGSVTFADLLPPTQHTKIVAASAFHHILALASKSLIIVQQDVPYGQIDLRLPEGV